MRPRQIHARYHNEPAAGGGTALTYQPDVQTVYTEASNEVQIAQETQSLTASILTNCVRSATNFHYTVDATITFAGRNNGTPQVFAIDLFNLPDWPGFSGWVDVNESVVVTNDVIPPTITQSANVQMTSDSTIQITCTNVADNRKLTWKKTFVQ